MIQKIYLEPTNLCNLDCRTCMRTYWDVETGYMAAETFDLVVESVSALQPRPEIFFGGYGEPLSHPNLVDMVARLKGLEAQVSLITNGTLLTTELTHGLIAAGLDALWVSIDGAYPESYADVRLGAALPEVVANVRTFRRARPSLHPPHPKIGISFVAMKRNIADLPALLALGRRMGATEFMVSNLLPHTPEMCSEILYERSLNDILYLRSPWVPQMHLPKMDIDGRTSRPLYRALNQGVNVSIGRHNLAQSNDHCPFIKAGAMAIGWDGRVSPCPPLLYPHTEYLHGRPRRVERYVVGHLSDRPLPALWQEPAYSAFRARVEAFTFAPCTFCGGCDLSLANQADCVGNEFPTCGGCLWAQGVIQCP